MTEALPEAANAERLTDALHRSGALGHAGRVRDVAVESSRNTILSRIIRLRLTYDGAISEAPGSVIFKTGLPGRVGSFYTQAASAMKARLVPRCFEAYWNEEQNAWHLLLEDHAAWWDDPSLGTTVGTWSDADATDRYLQRLSNELKRFTDRVGDRLPCERLDLYDRLLAAAPRLIHQTHRNITIVQGDAHVWNCFLPMDSAKGDVLFFDWDSWRVDTGSDDLAYMMAMHWYPDRRKRIERPLLDLYHATLAAHGIAYDRP